MQKKMPSATARGEILDLGVREEFVDSQKMGQVISIFRFCSSGSFGHVCESVRLLCWLVERVQNEQGRLLEVDVQGSFHEAHGSDIQQKQWESQLARSEMTVGTSKTP